MPEPVFTPWDFHDSESAGYWVCTATLPDGRQLTLSCGYWGEWFVFGPYGDVAEGKAEDDDAGMRAAEQAARDVATGGRAR